MSKATPPYEQQGRKSVCFTHFWQTVADQLPHVRLHINKDATTINEYISQHSDIYSYLHRAIKQSFKLSHCQNLNSPLSMEVVLDVLGETAFTLQNEHSGDLFDVELLEEIAWLICDRYPEQISELTSREAAWQAKPKKAAVISFPNYKIRKANARL